MRRALRLFGLVTVVAVVAILFLLPPASSETVAPPASTVRGVYHIHTNRSDGSGTPDEVAAAAARAGLQFIILTDHGDGTRPPDPPAYRSGVLTLDAVELNTTGGHYAALGMPAAPYPLAGTPDAVIEDVRRLGGFGIAAHPGSPRTSLRWNDWDAAFDGLEWINGDSEWRDEPRLPIARALATYLLRSPESMATLLDRPSAVLEQWDRVALSRRVLAIAGSDAHARLGFNQRTDPDKSAIHDAVAGIHRDVSRALESCRPRCAAVGTRRRGCRAVIGGVEERPAVFGDRRPGLAGRPVVYGHQRSAQRSNR